MRMSVLTVFSGVILILYPTSAQVFADATENPNYYERGSNPSQHESQVETSKDKTPVVPFVSFTGKVTKNKVRLRQQPNLDSPILKELSHGELTIVEGEVEDFYAVQPPNDSKAYIFRTFVLDNVVEGNRVNVRLEPDTDSPVVAQLNAGTRVEGVISPLNSKWLEIPMPESARFYVAKDYIEKIGDRKLMATIEKRRDEVNRLLNSTYSISQTEMQKSFPEIQLEGVYENFNKLINSYNDFPEQATKAKELLTTIQDNYIQKKIAYLEAKAKNAHEDWNLKNSEMNNQMKTQQQRLSQLEEQLEKEKAAKAANRAASIAQNNKADKIQDGHGNFITNKMIAWQPREQEIYQNWASQNNHRSEEEFYLEQRLKSIAIKGIIEPYTRAINNKPGDYILINRASHLPIAYLYSTQVDLQESAGQEVTLHVISRPNNNFAFPAYFVIGME
ncbi:MAG: hypothetical protein H0X29_10065 [Parachlamydiaceae bacterium]|nr:hypothetical protein [Parachlamydiaceae bacterium]